MPLLAAPREGLLLGRSRTWRAARENEHDAQAKTHTHEANTFGFEMPPAAAIDAGAKFLLWRVGARRRLAAEVAGEIGIEPDHWVTVRKLRGERSARGNAQPRYEIRGGRLRLSRRGSASNLDPLGRPRMRIC